mmetsp:Transcript_1533/g.3289  ORF Transcript_1533/g.3289 Transcript_1533/m.3289 type:complete len:210 (-) Transcript_1533:135-764(-)
MGYGDRAGPLLGPQAAGLRVRATRERRFEQHGLCLRELPEPKRGSYTPRAHAGAAVGRCEHDPEDAGEACLCSRLGNEPAPVSRQSGAPQRVSDGACAVGVRAGHALDHPGSHREVLHAAGCCPREGILRHVRQDCATDFGEKGIPGRGHHRRRLLRRLSRRVGGAAEALADVRDGALAAEVDPASVERVGAPRGAPCSPACPSLVLNL